MNVLLKYIDKGDHWTEGRLNIMISFYQYRDSHKDKTGLTTALPLFCKSSYLEGPSLYWDEALLFVVCNIYLISYETRHKC